VAAHQTVNSSGAPDRTGEPETSLFDTRNERRGEAGRTVANHRTVRAPAPGTGRARPGTPRTLKRAGEHSVERGRSGSRLV